MQRVISGESGQGNARVIPLVAQQGTPERITYIRDAGARKLLEESADPSHRANQNSNHWSFSSNAIRMTRLLASSFATSTIMRFIAMTMNKRNSIIEFT